MSFFSFRKDEILRKKKLIESLFAEGSGFYTYPFKIIWLPVALEVTSPAQAMFIVGKRSFRLAVDRNRVRRRVREAYRLHKHLLYEKLEQEGLQIALAIIYTSKEQLPSEEFEKKIKLLFRRLFAEIDHKLNNPLPSLLDN